MSEADKTQYERILVVDDSDFTRKTIVEILEDNGHNVVGEASAGKEATETLAATDANIIIIDVVMPDISGIELARLFKENFHNIFIIMISSLGHEHIVLEAIGAGAADFIKKPFADHELLASVEKLVDQIKEEESY